MNKILYLILLMVLNCDFATSLPEENTEVNNNDTECCDNDTPDPTTDPNPDPTEIPKIYSCQSVTNDGLRCYEYHDVYLQDVNNIECDNFGDTSRTYELNESECNIQSNELFGYCTHEDWGNYTVYSFQYYISPWSENDWKQSCELQDKIWTSL